MFTIPEKMKLNKFISVHIPRTKDLFKRYGQRISSFSAVPDDARLNDQPNRKIDTLQAINSELYSRYAREEAEKAKQSYHSSPQESDVANGNM